MSSSFFTTTRRNSNWNPLSSKGELDPLLTLLTLALVAIVVYFGGASLQLSLQRARLALDLELTLVLYGIWFVVSAAGFWLASNAFIKCWTGLLSLDEPPPFGRTIVRLSLLSPLLSVWLALFTLVVGAFDVIKPGVPRRKMPLVALASLMFFHLGFLGWKLTTKEARWKPWATLELAQFITPRQSLLALTPAAGGKAEINSLNATPVPFMPGEEFYLHVHPYLSLSLKLSLALYSDFRRGAWLWSEVTRPSSPLCGVNLGYLKVPVADCFFFNYRRVAEASPFATPLIGVLYEGRYRESAIQALMTSTQKVNLAMTTAEARTVSSAFSKLAPMMLAFNNVLTLLEPGRGIMDRSKLFVPRGLLPYFGSPERVLMELAQDAQRFVMARKVLPLVKPQLKRLEDVFQLFGVHLPKQQAAEVRRELESFRTRITQLERDPLHLRFNKTSAH